VASGQSASPTSIPDKPPDSATTQWVSLLGLGGFLVVLSQLEIGELSRAGLIIVCMMATAIPMIIADLGFNKVHLRPSSGLKLDDPTTSFDFRRVAIKLFGLVGTFALIGEIYWLLPEYHSSFYLPFWEVLKLGLPWLLLGSLPYFAWVDSKMTEPKDGYYLAGCLFVGRWEELDSKTLTKYFLGWLIKGFYLPIMTVYLGSAADNLMKLDLDLAFSTMPDAVTFVSQFALAVDLSFVAIGYTLTLRVTDSQIRSPNPLVWGWLVTIILYRPIWGPLANRYFKYTDGNNWVDWYNQVPALLFVWGLMIIVSKLGWVWANLSFGCRFSNLTHRGIITNGPYRLMKHPSYVFKNISWWLISVPFLSQENPGVAMQHTAGLLGVNLLYLIRARAEERHLSEDPIYVQYALWMNEHSLFSALGKNIPWFSYKTPNTKSAP
jgi:isoprenylcysteine carboxyl methyltransferase (ICMT) family protein YpbQ